MSKTVQILIGVFVAVTLVVAAGAWWFLRDDEPDAVSLDVAAEGVADSDGEADVAAGDGGIAGVWVVDAETGEFDFESATGTFAGFRITENLSTIGDTEAVGRTGDVSGEITIEGTTMTDAEFVVDLTTITTNESRRDGKVQEALETSQFPEATFVLTEPVELPAEAADGSDVSVDAVGELTVHGVTRDVVFPLEARLVDDTVAVVGSVDVTFADYDVEVPSAPIIVSVEDNGPLEIQVLLTRA